MRPGNPSIGGKIVFIFFSTISKIKLGYPGRRRGRWVLAPSSGTLPRQISGCNTARRLKSLEYHLGFYGLLSKRSPTNCRFDGTHSFLSWFFSCNAHRCSVENRKYCRRHITSVRPPPPSPRSGAHHLQAFPRTWGTFCRSRESAKREENGSFTN